MDQNMENPAVGQSPTQPPPPAAAPGTGTQESKNMGLLCHLLGLLTSFVGPLILWLIKKEEDPYLDHHGKEALNFQITVLIGSFVGGLLSIVCIGIVILIAVWIADIVFSIIACIAASQGKLYRYPVSLRLIK